MLTAGKWRDLVGAWPRWMRYLIAAGTALIVIATAAIVHTALAGPPPRFPGEYAFSRSSSGFYNYPTTISVGQAFHDHGYVPPAGIRDMRYSGQSSGYSWPYPFEAVFSFPCSEAAGFVTKSHLRYGGSGMYWPGPDVTLDLFAQAQGWHAATGMPSRWYYRAVPPKNSLIYEQVLIVGRTVCTAYLINNN